MAMSKGTSHYNHKSWEDGTFPILCQTCLGDNPFMRVMKDRHGSECKVCTRPFTTFRWCPGARMRYKKTEICQTCSRAKNICQTCLLDLQYGLPVQVRDSVLGTELAVPKSEVNREFFLQNLDRAISGSDPTEAYGKVGEISAEANEVLTKLARNSPYYRRNRAHICSFWLKGECKRGEECPYRHETPTDPEDPLSKQNISDRYHGTNDPVAEKMLKRAAEMPRPIAPEDKGITTLYIGSVSEDIKEEDLRDYFYQFGEIRSINIVRKSSCAFIQFTARLSAEAAIEKSFQKLVIKDCKLAVRWGRSTGKRKEDDEQDSNDQPMKHVKLANIPGLPIGAPGSSGMQQQRQQQQQQQQQHQNQQAGGSGQGPSGSQAPAAGSGVPTLRAAPALSRGVYYPSQDPTRMGAHSLKQFKRP